MARLTALWKLTGDEHEVSQTQLPNLPSRDECKHIKAAKLRELIRIRFYTWAAIDIDSTSRIGAAPHGTAHWLAISHTDEGQIGAGRPPTVMLSSLWPRLCSACG